MGQIAHILRHMQGTTRCPHPITNYNHCAVALVVLEVVVVVAMASRALTLLECHILWCTCTSSNVTWSLSCSTLGPRLRLFSRRTSLAVRQRSVRQAHVQVCVGWGSMGVECLERGRAEVVFSHLHLLGLSNSPMMWTAQCD